MTIFDYITLLRVFFTIVLVYSYVRTIQMCAVDIYTIQYNTIYIYDTRLLIIIQARAWKK